METPDQPAASPAWDVLLLRPAATIAAAVVDVTLGPLLECLSASQDACTVSSSLEQSSRSTCSVGYLVRLRCITFLLLLFKAPSSTTAMTKSDSWAVEIEKVLGDDDDTRLTSEPSSEEIMERRREGHYSIYRVPEYIKNTTNPDAYRPRLVSLGPFHHHDPALRPMEPHKLRAMVHMVKRSKKTLGEFITAVEEIAEQLRKAYENLEEEWCRGERFVELMVTDGCFLLEVMRAYRLDGKVEEDYGPNDPVFSQHGCIYLLNDILWDMIVIENQLPLLLFQKLMFVASDTNTNFQEDGVINNYFLGYTGCTMTPTTPVDDRLGLHPLDVLQKGVSGIRRQRQGSMAEFVTPSVTELHEAGVHFKVSKANGFGGAISFEGSVLSIPRIWFYDNTERLFLNLMAFERLHPGAGNDVNAFVAFMDDLIDTPKDVALLRSKGIIENGLGSDKAVADLINGTLTKGAMMSEYSGLLDVVREVNAHCKKPWNKWRASLIHTYFSNPWVFISLVAATVLLTATIIQTVYAVVSFHNHS